MPARYCGSRQRKAWVAMLVLVLPGATVAAPDAADVSSKTTSRVLQQNQQRVQQLQQEKLRPGGDVIDAEALKQGKIPPPGGPTVLLKEVDFEPASSFLMPPELDAITAPYLGKEVDFAAIATLVQQVNALYEAKGVVTASAVLPPQDLDDGKLLVRLVEGQLGTVDVVGNDNNREAFYRQRVSLTKEGTEVVDVPQAADDITFFNQTSQAKMRLRLQPGAQFGLTDLTLDVIEPAANQLYFFVDNENVRSVGNAEGGLYYRHYGFLERDDTLTVYGVGAEGSQQGLVNYEFPIGRFGTRMVLGHTQNKIRIVRGPVKDLHIRGQSKATTETLMQPVLVNQNWKIMLLGSLSQSQSSTKSSGIRLVDTSTDKKVAGYSVSYVDDNNYFDIQSQVVWARSRDHLGKSTERANIKTGSLTYFHSFEQAYSLNAYAVWQMTHEDFLPGDLSFQIGGPNSVRGYPNGVLSGDQGYFAQLELHRGWSGLLNGLDTYVFVDSGSVKTEKLQHQGIYSAGVGTALSLTRWAQLDINYGMPLRKPHGLPLHSSGELTARLTVQAL